MSNEGSTSQGVNIHRHTDTGLLLTQIWLSIPLIENEELHLQAKDVG